jgi:LmbE family N-acetylglucosaminyl deacetylase
MAIGAHADDVELGVGGTLAKHSAEGDLVYIVVVTDSDYAFYDGTPIRSVSTAKSEAFAAAEVLGAHDIRFLGFPTKCASYDFKLIEALNQEIDRIKPDVIYTHWDGDIHQDHSSIAQATITAGRNVPRILMYQSNWYKSYKHFEGNFYVDITEFVDAKVRSIQAHVSEVTRRGDQWIDFFLNKANNSGMEVGTGYAETFQVIKWLEK